MANSLVNIIYVPTRERALLDPIIVPEDLHVMDSGKLETPREISDHEAILFLLTIMLCHRHLSVPHGFISMLTLINCIL